MARTQRGRRHGALLDEAENEGRTTPDFDDRASLVLGGLHERFLRAGRPSIVSAAGLAVAVAFSIWYLAVISWSATAGSFSNPAVLTAAVFAVALALALARRPQAARIASAVAAVSALTMFALALTHGWLGPGPIPTTVFVGLGLMGAIGGDRRREVALLPVAIALAGLSVAGFQIAAQTYPLLVIPQFWIAMLVGIAAGAAAVLIVAISFVQREVSAASSPAR